MLNLLEGCIAHDAKTALTPSVLNDRVKANALHLTDPQSDQYLCMIRSNTIKLGIYLISICLVGFNDRFYTILAN